MFEFVRAVAWLIKSAFFGLGNCSVFLKATICGMKTMSKRKVCTMYCTYIQLVRNSGKFVRADKLSCLGPRNL